MMSGWILKLSFSHQTAPFSLPIFAFVFYAASAGAFLVVINSNVLLKSVQNHCSNHFPTYSVSGINIPNSEAF